MERNLEPGSYWGVITQVSDGWAVGVADELLGKRDQLGRAEHSWCVEWLGPKEQLSAWHRDQETLFCKDKPLKVGVLLELQKKTVSFYSIADKEVLLHTFGINTSPPLSPAFWLYRLERNGSFSQKSNNFGCDCRASVRASVFRTGIYPGVCSDPGLPGNEQLILGSAFLPALLCCS